MKYVKTTYTERPEAILGNLFLHGGQLPHAENDKEQLLHVKQRSLKQHHKDKGEGERDGSVSEDVVEGECVGDSDSVAGEAVDPVDEGDVDEVGGVGEAAQRHPAGPGQQPIHRTAHTLPQRTTLSSNNT